MKKILKGTARVGVALVCQILFLATASAVSAPTDEVTYAEASKLLKSGADNPRAVQLFEAAALEGDVRSVLMLGAILLEGKIVPQDRVKGYAYLQLAAERDRTHDQAIRDQAQKWMQASQASMSGSELIKADQFAVAWKADRDRRLAADWRPAIAVLTSEQPVTYDPVVTFANEPIQLATAPTEPGGPKFRSGCAAKARAGCPAASKVSTETTRCSGEIVTPDTAPSLVADGALLRMPKFPVDLRRAGVGGNVKLLVHVDRSGWVCGAVVAGSSGTTALDASALDSVGRWRLKPAMRNSKPVEALFPTAVNFQIQP